MEPTIGVFVNYFATAAAGEEKTTNFKIKMARKSNHVVPSKSDGWAVKKAGATKASQNFKTKNEAVKYARELSKNEKTELYIHKSNGMIQNKNSYGNDPNPPKDKR